MIILMERAKNYFSSEFVIVISTIVVLLALAGLAIFLVHNFEEKKVKKTFKKEINKSNKIIISFNDELVDIYNPHRENSKRTITYDKFLRLVHEKERNDFENWIREVSKKEYKYDNHDNAKIFTTVFNEKRGIYLKNLYCIYQIDRKNNKVFLNAEYLLNTPCNYNKNKQRYSRPLQDYDDIIRLYDNGFFLRGCSISIKFEKKDNNYIAYNTEEVRFLILDALFKFLDGSTIYFYYKDPNEFEINLLDKKAITKYSLKKMLNNINNSINKTFELCGYDDSFDFYIVGGLVSELPHDTNKMYEELNDLFKNSISSQSNIGIYEINNDDDESNDYKNEVYSIYRNKSIASTFTNVIKLNPQYNQLPSNYGYIAEFSIDSKKFSNFDELLEFSENYGKVKSVYAAAIQNSLEIYLAQRESYFSKFIFEIKKEYINEVIPSINKMEKVDQAHIVFLVDMNELLDEKNESKKLDLFKNIHTKGYEIAALIKSSDTLVDPMICKEVDAFFVESNLKFGVKADSRDFMKIHSLLDRLVGFKKPLIIYESNSFTEVELFFKAGIYHFSSTILSKASATILPLDKKVVRKLQNITKN